MNPTRARLLMLLVTVPIACSAGCSAPPDAAEDEHTANVVGGQAETGYAPVGYLMVGANAETLAGPSCGATLVAPHVALTAAHCIVLQPSPKYGIGFGDARVPGVHIAAKHVFAHPGYNVSSPVERFRHDIAVLILESDSTVPPASIGIAAVGNAARYIGYGRTTAGTGVVTDGYTGERKSTTEHVTKVDALSLWTTGEGGGLCWGDSGGPMMRGNEILGVLADFDGLFDCQVGNKMIFTSLVGERTFIEKALSCQDSVDPACLGTVFEPADGGVEAGPASDAGSDARAR